MPAPLLWHEAPGGLVMTSDSFACRNPISLGRDRVPLRMDGASQQCRSRSHELSDIRDNYPSPVEQRHISCSLSAWGGTTMYMYYLHMDAYSIPFVGSRSRILPLMLRTDSYKGIAGSKREIHAIALPDPNVLSSLANSCQTVHPVEVEQSVIHAQGRIRG